MWNFDLLRNSNNNRQRPGIIIQMTFATNRAHFTDEAFTIPTKSTPACEIIPS